MTKLEYCQGCLPHHSKKYDYMFYDRPCTCTCHVPGGRVYGRKLDAEVPW